MKKQHLSRVALGWSLALVLAQLLFPRLGSAQWLDPALSPALRIVSPANRAVFYGPVDIPIFAYLRPQAEVTFTNVEFFYNGASLGSGVKLGSSNSLYSTYGNLYFNRLGTRLHSLHCLVWTNAPAGSYSLTAVASGFNSLLLTSVSRTSPPVNITIEDTTAGTNLTDVASIVATDPIAIAGTNSSWVWQGGTNITPAWTSWPPPRWQLFTNWGPKAALLSVRRFGDATEAVTINYAIGGTASNGVDYATLPGFVNIPAGGAYGLIPIVPIDNGTSSVPKMVVLTLTPSTNTPADYVLGTPSRAAAVIFYNWRRGLPLSLPDGSFYLNAAGPDGAWFSVQNSTDLLNWFSVSTNQVFQGSIDFLDLDAPTNSMRFYRPVPLSNPPNQP